MAEFSSLNSVKRNYKGAMVNPPYEGEQRPRKYAKKGGHTLTCEKGHKGLGKSCHFCDQILAVSKAQKVTPEDAEVMLRNASKLPANKARKGSELGAYGKLFIPQAESKKKAISKVAA